MLWYHDHAMGINRLNIYAGMFGLFLIRDDFEDALNLPKGAYEIPLVIYDRLLTARRPVRLSGVRRSRRALGSRSVRRCHAGRMEKLFRFSTWSRANIASAC